MLRFSVLRLAAIVTVAVLTLNTQATAAGFPAGPPAPIPGLLPAATSLSHSVYLPLVTRGGSGLSGSAFIGYTLPIGGVAQGDAAWGDYDNDGDLDLLVAGVGEAAPLTRLLRNDHGVFADTRAPFAAVYSAALAWGDYDNDGDLDAVVTGGTAEGPSVAALYRNDAGSFVDADAGLLPVGKAGVAWGDYDNDGDLDLLIIERGVFTNSRLYRNEGGYFVDSGVALPAVDSTGVAWGDYDLDGDLDLFIADGNAGVLRNDGLIDSKWTFTKIPNGLGQFIGSHVELGDYDSDGDLDALISGSFMGASILRYDGGDRFSRVSLPFSDYGSPVAGWGDYDGDGDLDIVVTGGETPRLADVYRNAGSDVFQAIHAGLVAVGQGPMVAWGDYNADGALDFLMMGQSDTGPSLRVYRNALSVYNRAPSAPTGLTATPTDEGVRLSWAPAGDNTTPAAALTYNVRVGSAPGQPDVLSPEADIQTGHRFVPALGNAQTRAFVLLRGLTPGATYYWSVQAIDNQFGGGSFSNESSFVAPTPIPPVFENIMAPLPGVRMGAGAWGDCDNDGDLDLVLSGDTNWSGSTSITQLYRNDGGAFVAVATDLPPTARGSLTWADYDNDNDLDLALLGWDAYTGPVARLYRNDGGCLLVNSGVELSNGSGTAAWGDYDNDGDLDLLVMGTVDRDSQQLVTRLLRNDKDGQFTEVPTGLPGMLGTASWADYDGDGDLDVLLSGCMDWNCLAEATRIFRNDGPGVGQWTFSEDQAALPGLRKGRVSWGDYDNDGDLDLFFAGIDPQVWEVARVYRNDGGRFISTSALPSDAPVGLGAWGDYDNDGVLDLLLAGHSGFATATRLYRGDGHGSFAVAPTFFGAVNPSVVEWGDYDNDGDLDVLLAGEGGPEGIVTSIYRNNARQPNAAPNAPSALSVSPGADGVSVGLRWQPASDDHSPAASLRYNVRVGTTPGGTSLVSPMAGVRPVQVGSLSDGVRLVPALGNVASGTSYRLTGLSPSVTYYWSVQAIDSAFRGGPFGPEHSFVLPQSAGAPARTPAEPAGGQ